MTMLVFRTVSFRVLALGHANAEVLAEHHQAEEDNRSVLSEAASEASSALGRDLLDDEDSRHQENESTAQQREEDSIGEDTEAESILAPLGDDPDTDDEDNLIDLYSPFATTASHTARVSFGSTPGHSPTCASQQETSSGDAGGAV